MKKDSLILNILTLAMIVAAIMHFWIVPEHWSHALAHGLLFLILGIFQLVWSVSFIKRPSVGLARVGIYLAGGAITLWAITLFLPAPFGHGSEAIEETAIITKLAEALAVIFLIIWLKGKIPIVGIIKNIIISIVVGVLVYTLGKASEPLFPGLTSSELHHGHDTSTHHNVHHHGLPNI